jgi:hypothetical protein
MSTVKRALATAGIALALGATPALLTSTPATAGTASTAKAAGWDWVGEYSSSAACHLAGQRSYRSYQCAQSNVWTWHLYIWV